MSLGYEPQDMWLRRSMEESDSGRDDPSSAPPPPPPPHQRTSGAVNPGSRHPFIPRTRVGIASSNVKLGSDKLIQS